MDAYIIAAVTMGAAAFRGVTGFGYALVAALGFASLFPPTQMVPFIIINDLVLTGFTVIDRGRSPIDWPVARIILAAGLLGALGGSLMAAHLNGDAARIAISATVMLAACTALIREPPAWLANRGLGVLLGFVTGILLSAFAVGGPLIAAWLLAGGVRRSHMRGTLAVYFGVIDVFTLASRAVMGVVDSHLLYLLAIYCPITFAGFIAGYFLSHRLPAAVWDRVAGIGLVVIAVVGFAQTIYALVLA
jgi:uncharacterized membrane protein YfcA